MKKCSKCKVVQAESEFYSSPKAPTGLSYWCKSCAKKAVQEWNLKNPGVQASRGREWWKNNHERGKELRKNNQRFKSRGITPQRFVELFLSDPRCRICQTPFKTQADAYVDHCHKTKKFRGLLCHHCNTGLGMFKDSTDFLARAIGYLTEVS